MKNILYFALLGLFLASCGSSRNVHAPHQNNVAKTEAHSKHKKLHQRHENIEKKTAPSTEELFGEEKEEAPYLIKQEIIDYAKTFQGTRYKYGGTTQSGMDCSGLVCTAFKKENISLPRSSRDMALEGVPVSLMEIEKGDLLFFKTSSKNVISHVGLVVKADNGDVRFIHSTTRAGVIISSLDEAYWKKAFVEVRRVI